MIINLIADDVVNVVRSPFDNKMYRPTDDDGSSVAAVRAYIGLCDTLKRKDVYFDEDVDYKDPTEPVKILTTESGSVQLSLVLMDEGPDGSLEQCEYEACFQIFSKNPQAAAPKLSNYAFDVLSGVGE